MKPKKPMKATVNIVKITPKQAEEYLGTQVKEQRPLRDSHVQTLARDMKDGNFRLSADAIVIIKGALANGQHRMWAVVECGEAQPFLLMETDDEELYKVLDCGLKRTVSDAAHVSNGPSVCAIAKMVMAYGNETITQYSFIKKSTRIDQIEYVQTHNEALQDACLFMRNLTAKTQNLAPYSAPAALIIVASQWYGKRPKEFLEMVYHGNSTAAICNDLRERFIKMRIKDGQIAAQYYFALMIKAFNAFVTNSKLGVIKMHETESFPKIVKPK